MNPIRSILTVTCLSALLALSACNQLKTKAPKTNPGDYYAVSLINNSLFFGHLVNQDDEYLYMTDVHYIQRIPAPQGKQAAPRLQLVKQSSDPIGPENEMAINKDQVLLYQKLRADSKIASEIVKLAKRQEEAANQPAAIQPEAPQQPASQAPAAPAPVAPAPDAAPVAPAPEAPQPPTPPAQ